MLNKKTKIFIVCAIIVCVFFGAYFSSASFSNRINNRWNAINFKISLALKNLYLAHIKDESPGVGPGNAPIAVVDPNHFSFVVMGDTQMFNLPDGSGGFKNAVTQIEKMHPALVMTVGDLVQSCSDGNNCMDYKMWKNIAKPILPITYEVVGNHDRNVSNKNDAQRAVADKAWQNYFTLPTNGPAGYDEVTYSFDAGNSHFIVLDTEKPREHKIDQDQLDWLEKDLAENKKDNTFVFYHEPAFPMSYKINQSLDVFPDKRDALWTILDKYNVTAVFNGHEHIFSRQSIEADDFPGAKNKIYQFIIGNTDAMERENVTISDKVDYYQRGHDFVRVDVFGKQITANLFSVDGSLVNSFTFSK